MNRPSAAKRPGLPAQGGFSLVEVLIAIAIVSFIVMSIMQLFILSAYTNRLAEEQTRMAGIAEYVIQELQRIHLDSAKGVIDPPIMPLPSPTESAVQSALTGDLAAFRGFVKTLVDNQHAFVAVPLVQSAVLDGQDAIMFQRLGAAAFSSSGADTRDAAKAALDGGAPLSAVAYWFTETMEGGQAHVVNLYVISGYRLSRTQIVGQARVVQTYILPPKLWYKDREVPDTPW